MQFRMRLNPLLRPLFLILSGKPSTSYVDVAESTVRFRFGRGFDEIIPRDTIAGAEIGAWPWWGGLGWRIGPGGTVGLIGSLDGIVIVRLRTPQRVRQAFIPLRCRRIAVSVEAPEALLIALRSDHGPG